MSKKEKCLRFITFLLVLVACVYFIFKPNLCYVGVAPLYPFGK